MTIYVDMDGVLCDFVKQVETVHGFKINNWSRMQPADRWVKIRAYKRFWSDMPWYPGSRQMWSYIQKYDVKILSAFVRESHDPNCRQGKLTWIQKHLGLPTNKIHLVKRHQKQDYAKTGGKPNILIDDFEKNIKQFNARGGIGIRFKSPTQVIGDLKKLGL